ncbi:MAG: hypothetical protein L6R28_15980 [Planctomycetes bacterium]|nr:hypothetical protein [Planctomycetota bacterium]
MDPPTPPPARKRPGLAESLELRRNLERRPWYRFHLSTGIILFVALAALVQTNAMHVVNSPIYVSLKEYYVYGAGWPQKTEHYLNHGGVKKLTLVHPVLAGAVNLGVALAFLFMLARACEWWIAWRAREQQRAAARAKARTKPGEPQTS